MTRNFFAGLINNRFKQLYIDAITEVIRGYSVTCTLIYGQTLFTDCPNCIFDPISGRSSGRYQTGGSSPFTGVCPICFGAGRLASESTSTISLAVVYNYKEWIPMMHVQSPNGYVQTISAADTIEDLKRAKEIIVDTSLAEHVRQRFERASEPQPYGIGDATVIATMWKRIEN